MAAAQVPYISGWMGSGASLATALLVVVPMIQWRQLAAIFQVLLAPGIRLLSFGLGLVDEITIFLVAAATSILATILAVFTGLASAGSGVPVLDAGPRLIASVLHTLRLRPGLRLVMALLNSFIWSPVKEEFVFRAGLQRSLAIACERDQQAARHAAPAASEAASKDGASPASGEWRTETSAAAKQQARLATSICFALVHLPVPTPRPEAALMFAVALPRAVAAGLSSYFLFGPLYEKRGLPAALGAHGAHNLMASTLHALQGQQRGWLHRAGVGALAPVVPAAIYANAVVRARRRQLRQRELGLED